MARIAYVNGTYAPTSDARVPIEDRGYQFADGVYEVLLVIGGDAWDVDGHLARWKRSLSELGMAEPMSTAALLAVVRRVLRSNRLGDALVYMQATRGVAPRDHPFPQRRTAPSVVVTARRFDLAAANAKARKGVRVITQPDIRWGRVDVKSISLLPNVLAKEAARDAGCAEAWLIRDGVVTEGAASNAWIVAESGSLVTQPLGAHILGGITRASVIERAREAQIAVEERAFTLDEARSAREAFMTSATAVVTPITHIDDRPVGDGAPGPIAARLREAYIDHCSGRAA
ncbi:MAG: D-amino-acid transaminase [Parvularculaceae bacterium]